MSQIIRRLILEVRYPVIFKYRETTESVYQDIISHYNKFTETDDGLLELAHDIDNRTIFSGRQRSGISMENITVLKTLWPEVDRYLTLFKTLNPKSINRFGVRSILLTPIEGKEYSERISQLSESQLIIDKMLLRKDVCRDFALILQGADKEYNYRTQCGMVSREEVISRHAKYGSDADAEVSLLSDIDVYIDNFEFSITSKKIEEMIQNALAKAEDFYGRIREHFKS